MRTVYENLWNLYNLILYFAVFWFPTSHVPTVSHSSHIPKHRRQACISAMVASKALRTEEVEAPWRDDKSNLQIPTFWLPFKGHFIVIIPTKKSKRKWVSGICFKYCAENSWCFYHFLWKTGRTHTSILVKPQKLLIKLHLSQFQTSLPSHPCLQLLLPILAAKLPLKAASSTASLRRKKPNQWPDKSKVGVRK